MKGIEKYREKRIETVCTIVIAICILSVVLSWKSGFFVFWPLIISATVFFFGLVIPKFGLIITIAWFKVAELLGWFSSKIILSILYFLFITPYAFFMKLFNKKDLLSKKPKESMFVERNKKIEPNDFQNPW